MFSKKSYDEVEKELAEQKDIDLYDDEMAEGETKEEDFSDGVSAAEYDLDPDFKSEFDELIELKNKKGIELKYSFNGQEIKEALKIFQRDTIYKRNMIYTAIFAGIFIMYMIGIFTKMGNDLSMFLAMICIACICFIWYAPHAHAKKTAKAADTHELSFTMMVYDDCVKIGEDEASFVLKFKNDVTKIFETTTQFLLCVGKERVFLVPKRFLEDGQTTQLKEIFSAAMGDFYIKKF